MRDPSTMTLARRDAYNSCMNDAADKIAIVTGASSGIGKATAVALFGCSSALTGKAAHRSH